MSNGKAEVLVRYQLLFPVAFKLATVGGFEGFSQKIWIAEPVGTGTTPTLTNTDSLEVKHPVSGLVWFA